MKNNPKKEKIYEYIVNHIQKNGYAPSVRDICKGLKITSTATVAYNIEKLKEEGKINKADFKNRALSVNVPQPQNTVNIPLVGQVAAGMPVLALQNIEETYTLPSNLFRGPDLFILKVKDNARLARGGAAF